MTASSSPVLRESPMETRNTYSPRPILGRHSLPGLSWFLIVLALGLSSGCTASSESPVESPEKADHPIHTLPDGFAENDLVDAEIATVGWDELAHSPVVLLREQLSGDVLPIWIGLAEAQAIHRALNGVALPRPMTHDLLANLLESLDAELEEVVVHDLREGTFHGILKLQSPTQEEPLWVDTRPSDGLALALRTGAVIRVARKLLEERPDYRFQAPEVSEQVVRFLGMTVVASNPSLREEFSLPDRPGLVVIRSTDQARGQGIERGDLILEIAGVSPTAPMDLLEAVAESPDGKTLSLILWRQGKEIDLTLDLEVPSKRRAGRLV